ncbi:hypothetical protein GWI33_000655 [Rhynchophorus ferrugineus]|uniref:Peptidase S1 domain-containing protein n=1 Tax=Rhynchophorus ferrugineus TaxID=354439 RepID=A0A834INV3_RHYFE|nr:hypothetical protein GWI33_000655 [Rhynchophorus ferrugineus]
MQWVSLFVCVLSFIKLNYAQQRPCTTARGTAGNCMKEELCVIPGGSTISTERLCGIDLDGSKLYCCEQKTAQVFTNFRGDVEDDSVSTSTTTTTARTTPVINVRLGEWDVGSSDKNCQGGDNLKVCNPWKRNYGIHSVYPHPKYSVATKQNDIGLIRLNEEVQFNDMISPICLPLANSYIFPGDKLTVAGWGLKSYTQVATTKQKVDLPVVATSECSLVFRNILKIKKGQFCAGGEARKDSCNGDSGAPLMRLSPEPIPRWSIEGIVSFGLGCGLVGRYGVYTKVSEYVGWIHNTVTS